MITGYQPNQWSKKYRRLSQSKRDQINKRTNTLFAQRTGVTRKLNLEHDQALALVWLGCRDEIMASGTINVVSSPIRQDNFFANANRAPRQLFDMMTEGVMSAFETTEHQLLMPWMPIARNEERKNVSEKAGEGTDPNVMKYLRASDDRYETTAKRNYTEKHGGEKVKWCSAFVNWCMEQAGIPGTNNARALSWTDWGQRITEPQVGAVVVLKTTSWRHVAFIDYRQGKFVMLGGNQKPAGGGSSDSVSYRPYRKSQVVGYRWPAGRNRPEV